MIELIPFGRENKISKMRLMQKTNMSEKDFEKELAKLRKKYIILTDVLGGYWRPNSKKELQDFIKKYQSKNYDTSRMIMLAYKELEKWEEC